MELIKGMDVSAGHQIAWINSKAKEVWADVISGINADLHNLEMKSVEVEDRQCGTVTMSPKELISTADRHPDLIFHPLKNVRKFDGFNHRHEEPVPGEDFYTYYAYSKSAEGIKSFRRAYTENNHQDIGSLLGFPNCCARFFELSWGSGYIDPIWQAAVNTADIKDGNRTVEIEAHPLSNPLLRYVGIRAGFHIPHSFHCKESIKIGEARLRLLPKDKADLIIALLSMPMTWTVLHGIAEIRTPIFWIVTGSVPTKHRYTVKVLGKFIPREAEKDD